MKSKKLIVYEILKQRIVNHDIKPGEPINDGIISRELEVSNSISTSIML
jgi:DNA-binding GntR family transcriptional regulator